LGGPVHSAAYEGKTEVVAYLLSRGANPNALEPQNRSPLYWASQNGHLETVRALLAGGADPNAGESALKEAKRQGHNDVVELLRQHGAKE
jgi:ankyrin repeat protein